MYKPINLDDKNCLFFSQTFEQFDHSQVNSNPIAESTVHSYKGGNINFINSGVLFKFILDEKLR